MKIVSLTAVLIFTSYIAQARFVLLEKLPTGNYYYEKVAGTDYVLLRKVGRIVVGISRNICFKGFANKNSIVDATRVSPPYNPASQWEHQRGEAINLNYYRQKNTAISAKNQAGLLKCIRVFSER